MESGKGSYDATAPGSSRFALAFRKEERTSPQRKWKNKK